MDLGRVPEARFPASEVILSDKEITDIDIDYVVERIGDFGEDNRAGIERTLHRISCIRNRRGRIVGLTCRIGRAVYGTITTIEDIIKTGESVLLLGRPGVGKTTMLREVARVLADEMDKRVVIVDTSNEIAGDGDIPHPAIGSARRMQVARPAEQHAVMIEAVENHMPEVIVIDEIGTELEAQAARTIAERGVQLVGTAHGNTLENLMANPTLSDLIGGIQSVTLGDEEARRRGTQKSILERKAPPTFHAVVEIQNWDRVAIHGDVAETVDAILRGYRMPPEVRELTGEGEIRRLSPAEAAAIAVQPEMQERARVFPPPANAKPAADAPLGRPQRVYPFGISRKRLEQAVRSTGANVAIVDRLEDSDMVLTDRAYYRRKPLSLKEAEARGIPLFVLKSNTLLQMEQALLSMAPGGRGDPVLNAMTEAEDAIQTVIAEDRPIELAPQRAYIRRLQHELAQRFNLSSRSRGREPQRRVRILPLEAGAGDAFFTLEDD
jgi:stage III sporulation protein SpoIIIAA